MDKEFSWNLPDINAIRERREREQLGLMESEALKARRALQFQNMLEGAQQAQQDQMAERAQMARWMELENKFAKRTMDPRMKMAAMLTMAGQPGLLQQMFMNEGAGAKEAQSEMDSLESSIANDMFALAGADNDTYDKLTGALIPLYKSKYDDLLKKGAKSRMGENWDAGWGMHLTRSKAERAARKKKAAAYKAGLQGLLPQ
jgi:hypothetical protein